MDTCIQPPMLDRMYYSIDNQIILTDAVVNVDRFSCNWTMVPKGSYGEQ